MIGNSALISVLRQLKPVLWLDGTDTSSMSLSGSDVLSWTDKINNITTTSKTGTVTYSPSSSVTFDIGASLTIPLSSYPNATVVCAYTNGLLIVRENISGPTYNIGDISNTISPSLIAQFVYPDILTPEQITIIKNYCNSIGAGSYGSKTSFGSTDFSNIHNITGIEWMDITSISRSNYFSSNNFLGFPSSSSMTYWNSNLWDHSDNITTFSSGPPLISDNNFFLMYSFMKSYSKNKSRGLLLDQSVSSINLDYRSYPDLLTILLKLADKGCWWSIINYLNDPFILIPEWMTLIDTNTLTNNSIILDSTNTNTITSIVTPTTTNFTSSVSCDSSASPSILAFDGWKNNTGTINFNGGLSSSNTILLVSAGRFNQNSSTATPPCNFVMNNANNHKKTVILSGVNCRILSSDSLGSGELILCTTASLGFSGSISFAQIPALTNDSNNPITINNSVIVYHACIFCTSGSNLTLNNIFIIGDSSAVPLSGATPNINNHHGIISVAAGRTLTLNGVSGNSIFTKAGDGTLTINGVNNVPIMRLEASSIGVTNFNSNTSVNSTLLMPFVCRIDNTSGSLVTLTNNPAISAYQMTLTFIGSSSLNLGTGTFTMIYSTGVSMSITVSANTLTIGGNIVQSSATTIIGLTKSGNGILRLDGLNSYKGATTLSAGSLVISKPISGPNKINTATFTTTNLTVNFNVGPVAGETYKLFPAGFSRSYTSGAISLTGTGVSGRGATWSAGSSTLTIT